MSLINECFLNAYTPPKLVKSTHRVPEAGDVNKHLKSRQTIHLTKNELDELAKNESFWFYESDLAMYNRLKDMNKMFEDGEFDDIDDGYGLSEYIGVHEKYLPSMDYLQYIAMNNINDIFMTVYDAHSLINIEKRFEILRDKIVGHTMLSNHLNGKKEIPKYEFTVPNTVTYNKFVDKKYEPNVLISCFQEPVHIISVNIPYSLYLYQPLPHNIYNWDINANEYRFGSLNEDEFNELLNNVCINGITKPLFMRMNGEVLSAVDDESNLIILIAKLLKLPYIPVNIYLSNEDIGKNYFVDAVIENTKNRQPIYKNIGAMKNIFEPYMIIHRPNEDIRSKNIDKYTVFSTDNNLSIRYINDINILSTLSSEDEDDEEINNLHKEMQNKLMESINNDINNVIKQLNGQE